MDGPSNERRNTAAAARTKGIPKVIDVAARQQVNDKLVVNHFEQRLRWPAG
ncbi:hypothetical protein P2W49_20700 [Yersinia intermedia]|nr:hypothetical protein P2W49_20700 [Yersinia intermedia]